MGDSSKSFFGNSGTALLSGAIDLGTSLFNHNLAEKSAQKQYDRQLEFWNRQNEYNSPSAQRQRFNQAGMNPMSATGQMATAGTSQGLSSVPGNEYAQQGALKLNGLASTLETLARIEKLGAETGLATQQISSEALRQVLLGFNIDEARANALIKDWEEKGKAMEYAEMPEFFRHRNAMYDLDEQYRSAQIDHENALKALSEAQTDESRDNAKKLVAETGLLEMKLETEKTIQDLNYELSRQAKSATALNYQQSLESKSRVNLNRLQENFDRATQGLRIKALRIANEVGASDAQIKEIEVVLQQIAEQMAGQKSAMYVDEDGNPTTWSYIAEGIDKIGNILGIALIPSVGGAAQLGKMIKPAKKIGY